MLGSNMPSVVESTENLAKAQTKPKTLYDFKIQQIKELED